MALRRFSVTTTDRCQMQPITAQVQEAVAELGIRAGQCCVFVPHTTAGVTINENADPDVVHDLLHTLDRLVPRADQAYRHGEGNSAAHQKALMTGSSVTVLVEDGRLALGTWQGIFFCEFDGPRQRQVLVG